MNSSIILYLEIHDSRFNHFNVTTHPSGPSYHQTRSTLTSKIAFSMIEQGRTYTYVLEPQDNSGQIIGTSITGTFVIQKGMIASFLKLASQYYYYGYTKNDYLCA